MKATLILFLLLVGCAPAEPRVVHVVVCWLKTPGDEAAREKLIATSRTFTAIPGVVSVQPGRALPSESPMVDDGFDVAVVITFESAAAMRAYEAHPIHQRALKEVLLPLARKVVVYDLEQ